MDTSRRHVSVRTMAEYLTGELSLLKRVDVESHTAVCERCAAKMSNLRLFIGEILIQTAGRSSESVVELAVQQFREKRSRLSALADSLRKVLAVLQFDSAGLAPALGVRSGPPSARQLLFQAEAEQIDLRIEPANQAWIISGQVLGRSGGRGEAILQGTAGSSEAHLNEQNEFSFTPIQAGTYRVILKLALVEIEIHEIRIGS